jgi:hypothetical protein
MPIDYEIGPGDCINSVALRHGFFPDTLWNHGSNAELKERRKDPNVLMTGDKLVIPDIKIKELDKATEKKHRFRRKGVPAKLHLRFLKPKDKLKNLPEAAVMMSPVTSNPKWWLKFRRWNPSPTRPTGWTLTARSPKASPTATAW